MDLRATAKNFSPIDTVGCRQVPFVGSGGLGFADRWGGAGAPADSLTSRRAGHATEI